MTKVGVHITAGSRDGFGLVAPRLVGCLNLDLGLGPFTEVHPETFTVFRPAQIYRYHGQYNGDIMPGFNDLTVGDMKTQAIYWWPIIRSIVEQEEAKYGVRISAVKVTNEVGGNDEQELEKLIVYETEIAKLANADGRIIVFGNCAFDSPIFPIWSRMFPEWIDRMCRAGNVYGRHAYGEPGEVGLERPFHELDYLRNRGLFVNTILGEAGSVSFPGVAEAMKKLVYLDNRAAAYPELGPFMYFTYGEWDDANIEDMSSALAAYLNGKPFVSWRPLKPDDLTPDLEREIWEYGRSRATVSLNADAALQKEIRRDAFGPTGSESWAVMSADGREYAIQPAGDWDGSGDRVYYARVGDWDNVRYVTDPDGTEPPPPSDDPLPGVELGAPFRVPFAVTSRFNAPRAYGLHEGIDFDILGGEVDSAEPILALYGGIVERVGSSAGYGFFVVIKHTAEIDGGELREFETWYAHTDMIYVKPGDIVEQGQMIAEIGTTGNSTGEHVHVNLVVPGYGLSGYVVDDVIDPEPYIDMSPGVLLVDLALFYRPSGSQPVGDILTLRNNWGAGDERQQLQIEDGGRVSYITKNSQWEKRLIYSDGIDLVKDTSAGDGVYYTAEVIGGDYSLPRIMAEGQEHERTERVTIRDLGDCHEITTYDSTTKIRLGRYLSRWVSPYGVRLKGVVELEWIVNGRIDEVQRLALGRGLCGWSKYTGQESGVSEVIPASSQQPNERGKGCFS